MKKHKLKVVHSTSDTVNDIAKRMGFDEPQEPEVEAVLSFTAYELSAIVKSLSIACKTNREIFFEVFNNPQEIAAMHTATVKIYEGMKATVMDFATTGVGRVTPGIFQPTDDTAG